MIDGINSLFTVGASIAIFANCCRLYQDKEAKGYSVLSVLFFCALAAWNTLFFAHYEAWFSLVGSLSTLLANGLWLGLLAYFRSQRKEDNDE